MWQHPANSNGSSAARPLAADSASRRERAFKRKLKALETRSNSISIKDHDDHNVKVVWCPQSYDTDPPEKPPQFPFQVYVTNGAKETLEDFSGFADRFAYYIESIGGVPHHPFACQDEDQCRQHQGQNHRKFHQDDYPVEIEDNFGSAVLNDGARFCHYRFEVYQRPFTNVLACVSHQRKETRHRNRNGIWPRMVPSWEIGDDYGHHGKIIVIDRDDWANTGLLMVSFDPVIYELPRRDLDWKIVDEGDPAIVEAYRIGAKSTIRDHLRMWWFSAGQNWAEEDLQRLNNGGFSPALYPAMDPMAHFDAEHPGCVELEDTDIAGPTAQLGNIHTQDNPSGFVDSFDKNELFEPAHDSRRLRIESYDDSFGMPVTSVWNPQLSSIRPRFFMTLYLAFDMLPIQPKALFSCLNKGLISHVPWALDIVRNMPSLDAALDYHSRSSAERTPARTQEKRFCMQMLITKVIGNKLPVELVDYIEELVVPPEYSDYSSRPSRLFSSVFMYLDARHLSTGPWLVYTQPADFWRDTEGIKGANSDPGRWRSTELRLIASHRLALQVKNLRYWHRVADEIHILWSFCRPRAFIAEDEMPHVSVTLTLPNEIHWNSLHVAARTIRCFLHSTHAIVIHEDSFLSHNQDDAWELIDIDTGCVLPKFPSRSQGSANCYRDSWNQTPALGFHDTNVRARPNLITVRPGQDIGFNVKAPEGWWEPHHYSEGLLVDGRVYALRLSPELRIPRWTFGTAKVPRGPYNLAPIQVMMSEESDLTFRYIGPTGAYQTPPIF